MTSAVDPFATESSDAELIRRTRDGDADAYGALFARHADAARMLAARLTSGTPVAADDVVSDAFVGVLAAFRAGKGPEEAFRPYLYTAVRNGAAALRERESRAIAVDDLTAYEKPGDVVDPAVTAFESEIVQRAFASLPERWQAALWYHAVEGMKPAAIAPMLGVSPNGVSALLVRAREGLREAYLVEHLGAVGDERPACRETAGRLGAYVRGSLSRRDRRKVDAHLAECADCRAMAAEVAEVDRGLLFVVAPLVMGGVGAAGLAAQRADRGETTSAQSAGAAARAASWRVTKGGTVAIAAAGIIVVAMVALAVAGVLGGERDDVAAPPAPPSPAPSSDLLPDTSNDDTPQETPPATEPPEPPTDASPPPRPPAPSDPPPEVPPEEPEEPEIPTVTLPQTALTGTVTVVDRDHPTLALTGTLAFATVTWVSDAPIGADGILFEMPPDEYFIPATSIEQQTLPDGAIRYVSTADATAIVAAFSTSTWAVDESFGVVDWRIEIVEDAAGIGGVRLDGPLELAASEQVAIALIAPGSGTAYLTTLDGSQPAATVVDGVLTIQALTPTVVQRIVVVFDS
jgi:RNA polymerase sigma factor (sigma-70 family)